MRIVPRLGVAVLAAMAVTLAGNALGKERQVPVVVRAAVGPGVKAGGPIPLRVSVTNGLPSSIDHHTYRTEPVEWNGETVNVSLVDIYRDGSPNQYLARPRVQPPLMISGMGRREIKPGATLTITTDAAKWKTRDGWKPGRYKVTVRVDNLRLDDYSTLSVLSDPVEFTIE